MNGATRDGLGSATWAIHGDCLEPWWTEYVGRPRTGEPFRPDHWFTFTGKVMTVRVRISNRCRRCEKCRRARYREWRHRIRDEVRRAPRSWFGTLTLSPSEHHRMMSEARHKALLRSVRWEDLSERDRDRKVTQAILLEVTKYIKRVRHHAKVPFRYVLVTERHKSGLVHLHMLVHESTFKPVPHAILSKNWHMGFEKWRLIRPERPWAAEYVAKYLMKEADTRIRASQAYGREQVVVAGLLLAQFKELTASAVPLDEIERG